MASRPRARPSPGPRNRRAPFDRPFLENGIAGTSQPAVEAVGDASDAEDFLDVAQQLQQAEIRQRLKVVVESNRGRAGALGPTSSTSSTVLSLRRAASARRHEPGDPRLVLSAVSEASSDGTPGKDSFNPPDFLSAPARYVPSDLASSAGAPASGEDELAGILGESTDDDRADNAAGGPRGLVTASAKEVTGFATREELAAVLACLRRVERKVDWLLAQERKQKPAQARALQAPSLVQLVLDRAWFPAKAAAGRSLLFGWLVPLMDLCEKLCLWVK